MYNNSYGYGVYKRNQVNIGSPYQVRTPAIRSAIHEEDLDASDTDNAFDQELLISQDIVHKAKEDAALIKREAELEAERILSEAKEKADRLFNEMEQKAKEEGYRFGETLAQQHYNDLLAEAQEFRDRSITEYEDTLASLEHDILHLVVNIAAKVVGDEVRKNRDAILGIIRETIQATSNHEHVVLKVSDQDYNFVVENEDRLRSMVKDLNDLEIRKDGSLAPGSCVIDTGFGSVDGSCDLRLMNIREAFFEILGEAGGKAEHLENESYEDDLVG